jgi:hypothetical protein
MADELWVRRWFDFPNHTFGIERYLRNVSAVLKELAELSLDLVARRPYALL